MSDDAPYCRHVMGGGGHCYRRTWHPSGLCSQHRDDHLDRVDVNDARMWDAWRQVRANLNVLDDDGDDT